MPHGGPPESRALPAGANDTSPRSREEFTNHQRAGPRAVAKPGTRAAVGLDDLRRGQECASQADRPCYRVGKPFVASRRIPSDGTTTSRSSAPRDGPVSWRVRSVPGTAGGRGRGGRHRDRLGPRLPLQVDARVLRGDPVTRTPPVNRTLRCALSAKRRRVDDVVTRARRHSHGARGPANQLPRRQVNSACLMSSLGSLASVPTDPHQPRPGLIKYRRC
jgi:hypothetical protein